MAHRLLSLAEAMEGKPEAPAEPDREVSAETAAAIMSVSTATAYRWAKQHGIGWQLPSGQFRFSSAACRALVRRARFDEINASMAVNNGSQKREDYSNDE